MMVKRKIQPWCKRLYKYLNIRVIFDGGQFNHVDRLRPLVVQLEESSLISGFVRSQDVDRQVANKIIVSTHPTTRPSFGNNLF